MKSKQINDSKKIKAKKYNIETRQDQIVNED